MIVWVVESGEYSLRFIQGVFTSLNAAKTSCGDVATTCPYLHHHAHGWVNFQTRLGMREEMGLSNNCVAIDITPYVVEEEDLP